MARDDGKANKEGGSDSPGVRKTEALPGYARFSYPSAGVVIRPQPPRVQGQLRLVQLPPGNRGDWWANLAPAQPLQDYSIALGEFAPNDRLMQLFFGDVDDQVAFEAANLGSDERFLLKSPDGGVWRTRIEERLAVRALPGKGPHSIEAWYRLEDTETLSEPRPSPTGS